LARSLGTLVFGQVCGHFCWILRDQAGHVAEARRVDGLPIPELGEMSQRKAHTLRGSLKSWPGGAGVLERRPHVRALMLVEGGPDYLAVLHFCLEREVHDVLPIAMLGRGTGARIHPEALALLQGRRVRLYPHADADGGGMAGARLWAAQLHQHGCQVDFFTFTGLTLADGRPVKDLNDAALLSPALAPRLAHLFP
ncbi:MAG: zinc finger protein, partial [Verrucomicrobiaceae bacterium]|nr:zinc finger protein [Verrucomicrobiaceae bacterium]